MWKTIRKLLNKILHVLSVSGDKPRVFPEKKQKSIKDESYDLGHTNLVGSTEKPFWGKEQEVSVEIDVSHEIENYIDAKTEREVTELDDSESRDLILHEDSTVSDEPKESGEKEFFEVDFSNIEEEIIIIEDHFFDEPVEDVNLLDSDTEEVATEVIETIVDEVDQISDEEETVKTIRPPIPSIEDNNRPIKKKVDRKRKRKYFYYDIHPIPVLADEKIEELTRLAEKGVIKDEFGYDGQKLEIFLLNVYKQYDFIGEIPFGRKSFEYFCDLIQKRYIKGNREKITQVPPALFVASMVFCARYSEEEARNFWEPYADIVWRTDSSQYFQNVSRKHFVESKLFLQKNFEFTFPIIRKGDVVRPVYYQAVIPYYLQSNFAEWLVERFEQLLEFSIDDLPHVLGKEKSLDYVPPRLRNFVQQSETSGTAAKLIRQMAKAVRLFQTTEQYETVVSVMSSPIERSLWREIYQNLIEKQLQLEKVRKYTPKLEWVWNLDDNGINLRLSQVRASKDEKPNLIVWAKKESHNLRGEEILLDVHPWQLASGDWELEPEYFSATGDLNGKIYVLSEEFDFEESLSNQDAHIILEKEIPKKNDIMFFFISVHKSIAKEKEKINLNGDWIILSKDSVDIIDSVEKKCMFESIYIPIFLRENGFNFAKKYSLNLPVTLQFQGKETILQHPQTSFVLQAELFSEKQIENLSPNIQSIYQTSDIQIRLNAEFAKHQFARTWVSVHRGGVFVNSVSLAELQKKELFFERNGYIISLEEFVDEPGSYSVNILHDLQLLLEEDLRFAYLPNVNIIGPDPTACYSPANPPEIIIGGVDESRIKTGSDEKIKISQSNTNVHLIWKELRLPKCRFSLQWEGNNVNFGWDINRVSAWIDGGGDKKNVLAGQDENVILNARGGSKEEIVWFIKETKLRRKINLDYKGEYCRNLNQSALRDLLKNSMLVQSNVAITIREYTWDVFIYNKTPSLSFKSVEYDKPYINFSLSQSTRLVGDFIIQLRNREKPIRPITISRVKQLEENSRFEVDLLSGKYQAEIQLDNEILAVSRVFIVKESIEVIRIPDKEILITKDEKFTTQKLFDSLTSDRKKLLSIKDKCNTNHIAILNQLIRLNCYDTWITKEKWDNGLKKLLPSWAVLQYPLRFHTQKHNRILHIFPQQVALGAKAGKGYMSAKLEHNPVKIYAAWNSDLSQNKTQLWLKISQEDETKNFCEMDELDLWPAYQCIDCGMIVGTKSGTYLKLSPQTTIAHLHNKSCSIRDQFLDVVDMPIEVKISQYKEKKLSHHYWPSEVVGDNYFNDLFDGRMRPLQDDISIPIDAFKATDYYIAISEVYQNYKNPKFKIPLQQIIGKGKLFKEIKDFVFEKKEEVPAFSAALRLHQQIVSKNKLYFLPKYVLLLSLVLRFKAYNPQLYKDLLDQDDISENEIIRLTFQAMVSCPKLLEWSIAWAEIFFNHAIS